MKNPAKSLCIFLLAILMQKSIASAALIAMLPTAARTAENQSEPKDQWIYREYKDAMRNEMTIFSENKSLNFENLKYPYGKTFLTLEIRKKLEKTDIYFSVPKGQMPCHSGCKITVRFDEDKPQTWNAVGPLNSSSDVIFIRDEKRFLAKLRKSQSMIVEISFYDQGMLQFKFLTAKLK